MYKNHTKEQNIHQSQNLKVGTVMPYTKSQQTNVCWDSYDRRPFQKLM